MELINAIFQCVPIRTSTLFSLYSTFSIEDCLQCVSPSGLGHKRKDISSLRCQVMCCERGLADLNRVGLIGWGVIRQYAFIFLSSTSATQIQLTSSTLSICPLRSPFIYFHWECCIWNTVLEYTHLAFSTMLLLLAAKNLLGQD